MCECGHALECCPKVARKGAAEPGQGSLRWGFGVQVAHCLTAGLIPVLEQDGTLCWAPLACVATSPDRQLRARGKTGWAD